MKGLRPHDRAVCAELFAPDVDSVSGAMQFGAANTVASTHNGG